MSSRICSISSTVFEISPHEEKLYQLFEVPPPTLCPVERSRRRLAFWNDRNIYWRKCYITGVKILSVLSPEKPLKVISDAAYWSDQWNAKYYAQEIDFTRPFFEQWATLQRNVPFSATGSTANENSEYVSHSTARAAQAVGRRLLSGRQLVEGNSGQFQVA